MSFFEPPPPPPPRDPEPPPEWHGPPDHIVGRTVALDLVLGESDRAAVVLSAATAYPTGLHFQIDAKWRPDPGIGGPPFEPWGHRHGARPLSPEVLRFGVEFADGTRVTTLRPGWGADEKEPRARLMPMSGHGHDAGWSQECWLWPLPGEGPVSFVCEWPALDIELTRNDVDATLFMEAAAGSRRLWDPGSQTQGGSWTGYGPARCDPH